MKGLPLFLLMALVASPAWAIAPDHCVLLPRTPRDGATNVPPSTSIQFELTQCPEPSPRLLAPDGAAIDFALSGPTTSGDRLAYVLTPRTALAPGQYRMDLGIEAGAYWCGETTTRAAITSFTVGPDPKLFGVGCQLSGGEDNRLLRAWVSFSEDLAKEATPDHFEVIPAPDTHERDGFSWVLGWDTTKPRASETLTIRIHKELPFASGVQLGAEAEASFKPAEWDGHWTVGGEPCKQGCGCSASGTGVAWASLLALVALRRRRFTARGRARRPVLRD